MSYHVIKLMENLTKKMNDGARLLHLGTLINEILIHKSNLNYDENSLINDVVRYWVYVFIFLAN